MTNVTAATSSSQASTNDSTVIAETAAAALSADLASSLWGPTRVVLLERVPNKSLGISIVGGKLDVFGTVSSPSSPQSNNDEHGNAGRDFFCEQKSSSIHKRPSIRLLMDTQAKKRKEKQNKKTKHAHIFIDMYRLFVFPNKYFI